MTTLVTLLHRHLSKCFQGGSIAATLEGLTYIYTKTLSKYACCAFQVLGKRHYLSNVIISGFSNLHLVLGDESLSVGVVRLGAERARVDQALAGIRDVFFIFSKYMCVLNTRVDEVLTVIGMILLTLIIFHVNYLEMRMWLGLVTITRCSLSAKDSRSKERHWRAWREDGERQYLEYLEYLERGR